MRSLVLLSTLLSITACKQSTELLLVMSSDLVVPTDADELSIAVTHASDGSSVFSRTYLLPSEATLPASLDLSSPDASTGSIQITVQLQRSGAVVVERRAVLPFAAGRSLELHLALERSCVAKSCDPSLTCADGSCVSPMVDPTTLTPVRSDPFAPVPNCPPTAPAKAASGCVVYDFHDGKLPADLTMQMPADVAVTFECGMLHAVVPAGVHDARRGDEALRLSAPSQSGTFRASARMHTTLGGYDSYAGLMGYVSPSAWVAVEIDSPDVTNNDRVGVFDSASFGQGQLEPGMGELTHEISLDRTDTGPPSTYTMVADGVPQNTHFQSQVAVAQHPTLYAGNNGPKTDVYFEYLMVCAP